MTTFKVAPDYTIATDNGQVLDEWIGKSLELFTKAMGRPADHVQVTDICGRRIEEHIWSK